MSLIISETDEHLRAGSRQCSHISPQLVHVEFVAIRMHVDNVPHDGGIELLRKTDCHQEDET